MFSVLLGETDVKIFVIFLSALLFFAAADINAQQPVCDYCKAKIAGNYTIVEGKAFHKEHFLCATCGKPIEGSYNKKDNKFYHAACFSKAEGYICSVCGKVITEAFITFEGKKYHKDCYTDKEASKCAVCRQPIFTESQKDEYGNVYHFSHVKEYKKCENCGRLICENITGGGKKYSDGRDICYLCSAQAIYENEIIRSLFREVKDKMFSLGIKVPDNITVEGVDRQRLKKEYGSEVSPEMKGFCGSVEQVFRVGNKIEKVTYQHKVYVLNGVPALFLSSTIAHELMHAWIYENAGKDLPPKLAEGSCNFASYLYLKDNYSQNARIIMKRMEISADPVYGAGYRNIYSQFSTKPVSDFLTFLKKEGGMKK